LGCFNQTIRETDSKEIPRRLSLRAMTETIEELNKEGVSGEPFERIVPDGHKIAVTLLTGGGDRPYAFGLATELIRSGAVLDLIGSDELDSPEFHGKPQVRFLNLRGDQRPGVGTASKVLRVLAYYWKLIRYALTSQPRIFHILWNNKFQSFDRTVLMLYYRALRKRIVLTVHNVNAGRRDSKDSAWNRLTLRIQYHLADHLFVHTEKMRLELSEEFGVQKSHVTVVPFGINNAVPNTSLTPAEAKQRLRIQGHEKTLLFFGNIAPYKGLEHLVDAFRKLLRRDKGYRLIIAGRPKDCERYWDGIQASIQSDLQKGKILLKAEYIPDAETEVYFKGSDVLVLPYTHVYQSGVLFLAHSFGLPVLAADVGCLGDEIVEGKNGFVFKARNSVDLAGTVERYFSSNLYTHLEQQRDEIRRCAAQQHSWEIVGRMTMEVYGELLGFAKRNQTQNFESSDALQHTNNPRQT